MKILKSFIASYSDFELNKLNMFPFPFHFKQCKVTVRNSVVLQLINIWGCKKNNSNGEAERERKGEGKQRERGRERESKKERERKRGRKRETETEIERQRNRERR